MTEEKYCKYCGHELVECMFGFSKEDRLGCIRNDCPAVKAWKKNLEPTKDGYPKDRIDYVKVKVRFDAFTGKMLEGGDTYGKGKA